LFGWVFGDDGNLASSHFWSKDWFTSVWVFLGDMGIVQFASVRVREPSFQQNNI
jgi:hypothetical protein